MMRKMASIKVWLTIMVAVVSIGVLTDRSIVVAQTELQETRSEYIIDGNTFVVSFNQDGTVNKVERCIEGEDPPCTELTGQNQADSFMCVPMAMEACEGENVTLDGMNNCCEFVAATDPKKMTVVKTGEQSGCLMYFSGFFWNITPC